MTPKQIQNFEFYNGELDWLKKSTIYLTKAGSHAYGTNIETSDLDLRGVCIPPERYFLGFTERFDQTDKGFGELDGCIFSITKFFKLASECNPNVVELLFTDPNDWYIGGVKGSYWGDIVAKRDLFVTKRAKYTFSGYAMSQLKRIETHRKWLLSPPNHKPTREEFGLGEVPELPKDELQIAEALIRKQLDKLGGEGADMVAQEEHFEATGIALNYNPYMMSVLIKERKYNHAMRNWYQFSTWKTQRNHKRAADEAKYGYDTKHGLHLCRLMKMGYEILTTGQVIVKRPDADELLAIRAGAWSYDKMINWAENMENKLKLAYTQSILPNKPDLEAINSLHINIVKSKNQ